MSNSKIVYSAKDARKGFVAMEPKIHPKTQVGSGVLGKAKASNY